jgi:diketogulonate reductase-like aldo/keto reductase
MQRKQSSVPLATKTGMHVGSEEVDEKLSSIHQSSWRQWPCWLQSLVLVHLAIGIVGFIFAVSRFSHTVATTPELSPRLGVGASSLLPKKPGALRQKAETIVLKSGLAMPALGFGTCCRPSARGPAITKATVNYLMAGGRLVDTAMAYGNHKEIGAALAESGIPREEIWLTSKIAPNAVKSRNATIAACTTILSELGTNYLDLLLIHSPKLKEKKTVELWKGLIDLNRSGKVKAIGVSNFNWLEIQVLEAATGVLPEVNQLQFHPWTPPAWKEVVAKQRASGVATTAFTSLGGSRFRKAGSEWGASLRAAALKHNATEAQVLLRWALQQGVAVIPGASSDSHIRENLGVPRFVLSAGDMSAIEGASPPVAWFDDAKGPAKFAGELADVAWHA